VMLAESRTQWLRAKPFIDNDWIAGPGIEMVRHHPEVITKIRENGRRVHCWVVNTQEEMDACVALGIEALITDRPEAAVTYLTKLKG
jgi:glycerophosphoryl diester phosphodiesterase